MPPKPAGKDTKTVIPESVDQINLKKYCPKKIFDILFINESDEYSRDVLGKVIETGRDYEDISCLTFITYDEVMDLIIKHESVTLPPAVKLTLANICTEVVAYIEAEEAIPTTLLAQLMKLKLTEVMYQHYIKEVTRMLKRKKLEEDLNILTKECKKGDSDKGKGKGKDDKSSKSSAGTNKSGKGATAEKVIEDYTAIPIQNESDIIFDDDIFNHVWFYAFQGFLDPGLLRQLHYINVPFTAVIKVSAIPNDDTISSSTSLLYSLYDDYWNCLFKYFDGPKRLVELENTILMRFTCSGADFKGIFQEVLYVIKNISDIKLQHVNYVRHLKIYDVAEEYNYFPLQCLNLYNKILDKIPLELSNEVVVLNGLLNEACARVDEGKQTITILENSSQYSVRPLNSYSAMNCVDPCKIDVFVKSKHKLEPEKIISNKLAKNFYIHESDTINIVLNTYKKHGPLVYYPVLDLLKIQKPLQMLDQYLTSYSEILHKHDVDPSTKTFPEDEDVAMHIYYLIFFYAFNCRKIVTDFEDTDLTENLQIYHKIDFVRSAQTVVLDVILSEENMREKVGTEDKKYYEQMGMEDGEGSIEEIGGVEWAEEPESFEKRNESRGFFSIGSLDTEEMEYEGMYDFIEGRRYKSEIEKPFRNYYDRSAIHYFWKEKLSSDVLLQETYKAHNEYLYMEQKFSPQTDNLLLQFSDCLDEFGVHTKIYEQSLITPICLRDFCRYVTVQSAEWLDKNKPPKYFRQCEELETCKGVNRINRLKLFQEYSHLLETTIKTDDEIEEKPTIDESGVSFDQMVEELKTYPPNTGIPNECKKAQYKKQFLAYDFGSSYFQIKGGKTVFQSHDGIKISVDNTRFLDENPKCTINLNSKGNSLIVHYNKFYYFTNDYTFHMNLADGTIITFIVLNPFLRRRSRRRVLESESEGEGLYKAEKQLFENTYKEELGETAPEYFEEIKVVSVDQDQFKKLDDNMFNIDEESGIGGFSFKDTGAIFESLRHAAAADCPIYKVNNNLVHLKRLKEQVEIPLSNILNRILHKTIEKKNFASFTKRYTSEKHKTPKKKHVFDARIAWPNGLYISFFPSEVNKYVEVKQEFLSKNIENNSLIEHEEFRLFTREGYVLVKYIDGTIKILKSNGDTLYYEKLDAKDETIKKWRLRPCHCKNINDYRKKLNRMMKRNNETAATATISRRALFHTKKGYVLKHDLVNMLEESKVPYLKRTLIKFDGNRICIENGKVTRKRVFHVTDEQDFFAQDMYYERSDGFRSYFDKEGKQQVKFADGTKISSTIYVDPKPMSGGYVYVSLNFQYDHPNYATVAYSFDNSLEIILNNAVLKRDITDTITLKIDEDILATVKKENVTFQKTCLKCTSKCKCSINIKPFSEIESSSERFLYVRDSYNKQFCCDYHGNCQRNSSYIKGPFNVLNCNHYKKMSYKKMFVVDRDFSGFMFWTDNMVDTLRKKMEAEENVVVSDYKDINNPQIKVIKLRRKVFEDYCDRFLNTDLLKEQLCLAKYKQQEVKQLFYTTFRIMRKMTDFEGIKKCLSTIIMYFYKLGIDIDLLNLLVRIYKEHDDDPEDNMSTKIIIIEEPEPPVCKCRKKKLDMAGKVKRWRIHCEKYRKLIRNNVIIPYFKSAFCAIVEPNKIENEI